MASGFLGRSPEDQKSDCVGVPNVRKKKRLIVFQKGEQLNRGEKPHLPSGSCRTDGNGWLELKEEMALLLRGTVYTVNSRETFEVDSLILHLICVVG